MPLLLLAVGGFLVFVAALDAVLTTVAPRGGGPLTKRLGRWMWRSALAFHRRRSNHSLLRATGVSILVSTVLSWLVLLWLGWWLVSLADPAAVVTSVGGQPAGVVQRLYYVGFTLFTLGTGDFVPGTAAAQVLTPMVSLNGLLLATLGVTYLIPVASADTEKRSLAAMINALGSSPAAILTAVDWEDDLTGFETVLIEIGAGLTRHAERHLAYPVLHFLHASSAAEAATPAIVRFDEALTLIMTALAPSCRPAGSALGLARGAVDRFLTLAPENLTGQDPKVGMPDLSPLTAAGLPVAAEEPFRHAVTQLADRRRRLGELVVDDGWTWSDVSGG